MSITPEFCEQHFGARLRAIAADLHSHPELSFEETRTTQKILETLQTLPGVEVLAVGAKTGAVARLAGGSGPAVALRADIDAIPQHEVVQRPDASVYEGKMHACGHDIHTTALLGAAMALCEKKSALRGDVYFVFQPAEEALSRRKIPGGAVRPVPCYPPRGHVRPAQLPRTAAGYRGGEAGPANEL